jgi:hypothetical protein
VGQFSERTIETLQFLHEAEEDKAATLIEIRVPKNQEEKRYMGKTSWSFFIIVVFSKQNNNFVLKMTFFVLKLSKRNFLKLEPINTVSALF